MATDPGLIQLLDGAMAEFRATLGSASVEDKQRALNRVDQAMRDCLLDSVPHVSAPAITADSVNSPDHYTAGGIETIDFIKAKLTTEQFRGLLLGNVLKYLSRTGKKGDALEDLKKARWYLDRLITEDEASQ